jgi:small subunit ribosomal protein S18
MNTQQQPTEAKSCYFCSNNINILDYKDVILLRRYINSIGKIIPVRRTGTCAKHQRIVAQAVKRARIIGLLPFVAR